MKNKEKGITLIALIITIIVMLILVGVTINVALNGGLFDKAKTAADKTQREADREELLSAILGTANNRGDLQIVSELGNNLPDGWNPPVQSENNEYLQCTSQKNNVFYVNKETGAILNTLPEVVTETNVWKQNGLKSTNVQYGVTYTAENQENAPGEMSYFELDSNGGITFEGTMTGENLEEMGFSLETGNNYIAYIREESETVSGSAMVIMFDSNSGATFYQGEINTFNLETFINSVSTSNIFTYTVSE